MITRKYALLLLLLLQTVESNSKATKRWERVEFLRYQDFVCRIEGGRISSFDHDAPEPASSPEATFRDSEGNLVSPEEDEDGEDDLPIELELPDNPTVTNIPLQHHYDNLLLSGFLPSPSPIPPFPSSSPIPPSSLSKNCVLPGSLLCPVVSSRKTTALLSSLHASSWRAVRGVENTLASKVPLSEDASLLKGERCLEDGDDWVEFLSSVCLSRRGATLSVHRVPSSVKSGEEFLLLHGCNSSPSSSLPPPPSSTLPANGDSLLSVLSNYCSTLNPFPSSPIQSPAGEPRLCVVSKDGEFGFRNGIRARVWQLTGEGNERTWEPYREPQSTK